MTYPLLGRIQAPGDVKRLQESELPALCEEIRQFLIESVSATGGHLSSNLGVVELTVALHRALDLPQDKILFDVGHQCYTHKLLTGRMAGFAELRQKKMVTPFFIWANLGFSSSSAVPICTTGPKRPILTNTGFPLCGSVPNKRSPTLCSDLALRVFSTSGSKSP